MGAVFITGGTTGIGESLAEKFLENNYQVAVCGRNKSKFKIVHKNIIFYEADVSDSESIKNAVNLFIKKVERIDIFVANAGVGVSNKKTRLDISRDKFLVSVNVQGFLNSIESILDHFYENKAGKLVNIASIASMFALPGNAAYCASKSFVKAYSESISIDLKKSGIDVLTVLPGYVSTPLTRNNNHPMPFLINAKEASNYIYNAIERNKDFIGFPFSFFSIVRVINKFPRGIIKMVLRKIKYN